MNQRCKIRARLGTNSQKHSSPKCHFELRDQKSQSEGQKSEAPNRVEARINFRLLMSCAPPGIQSFTPSLSAGAATHCNSHSPLSLPGPGCWRSSELTIHAVSVPHAPSCSRRRWHCRCVIKSNTLSEALIKRVPRSPVASLTPGVRRL